jgi:cytolysin-activating lysine-acyltransferase
MENSKAVVDSLYLFNRSPFHSMYTLRAFNSYLILPLLHDKLRIFYEGEKPVSLVTWCWFTDEQADLFLNDEYVPTESDYARTTGEQLWGLEFIAPFGHAKQTMREIKRLYLERYGKPEIVHWRRSHSPDKLIKRAFT